MSRSGYSSTGIHQYHTGRHQYYTGRHQYYTGTHQYYTGRHQYYTGTHHYYTNFNAKQQWAFITALFHAKLHDLFHL